MRLVDKAEYATTYTNVRQLNAMHAPKEKIGSILGTIAPQIFNIEPYAEPEKPLKVDLGLHNIEE